MIKTWNQIHNTDMYKPLWGFVPLSIEPIKGEIIRNPKNGAIFVFATYKKGSNKKRKGGRIYNRDMKFSETEKDAVEEYNKYIDILENNLKERIQTLESKKVFIHN